MYGPPVLPPTSLPYHHSAVAAVHHGHHGHGHHHQGGLGIALPGLELDTGER